MVFRTLLASQTPPQHHLRELPAPIQELLQRGQTFSPPFMSINTPDATDCLCQVYRFFGKITLLPFLLSQLLILLSLIQIGLISSLTRPECPIVANDWFLKVSMLIHENF